MDTSMVLLLALGVVVLVGLLLIVRFLWIYREIQQRRGGASTASTDSSRSKDQKCKTLVVLGSGGHTSEMLHMVQQLDRSLYDPIHYVVADTDHTSIQRLEASPKLAKDAIVHRIPRSREVGQSFSSSLFTTLYALVHAMLLTIQIRPELVLCNGPGTCVPVVMGAWMMRILGTTCKFVFVESFCRVETLSLTGKLLYPLVDCFMVHWKELHDKYPNSHLSSTFVVNNNLNENNNNHGDNKGNNKKLQ